MDNKDFRKFIDTETKLIEISKWIAGEKMGRDPGEEYVAHWVDDHAKELREAWDKSKCKLCSKKCQHNLKIFCEEFCPEEPKT